MTKRAAEYNYFDIDKEIDEAYNVFTVHPDVVSILTDLTLYHEFLVLPNLSTGESMRTACRREREIMIRDKHLVGSIAYYDTKKIFEDNILGSRFDLVYMQPLELYVSSRACFDDSGDIQAQDLALTTKVFELIRKHKKAKQLTVDLQESDQEIHNGTMHITILEGLVLGNMYITPGMLANSEGKYMKEVEKVDEKEVEKEVEKEAEKEAEEEDKDEV